MINYLIIALLAYVIGSIPFAIISSKLFSLEDPRKYGSGNPGATNVLRSGNKKAALLTLIGDGFKGYIVVLVAAKFTTDPTILAIAILFVFLGHLYSCFLGFKGGKGVATSIGILLAFNPLLALLCILIWLFTAFTTRYSSLSALMAAIASPILYIALAFAHWWPLLQMPLIAIIMMCALLFYKHKTNIKKLIAGTESKIGQKKKA